MNWRNFQFSSQRDEEDKADDAIDNSETLSPLSALSRSQLLQHESAEERQTEGCIQVLWSDRICQKLIDSHGAGIQLWEKAWLWAGRQLELGTDFELVMSCMNKLEIYWQKSESKEKEG